MSLTVKAFLHQRSWKEEPVEIRRFSLDQDVSSNYSYLVQKIAQVFPSVAAEEIVLSWEGRGLSRHHQLCERNFPLFSTDAEGDYINISSDDELLEALDQFDGSIFKIHLKSEHLHQQNFLYYYIFCREREATVLPTTCVLPSPVPPLTTSSLSR